METITHNFNNNLAYVNIAGDQPNKKYIVRFINTYNNEVVYETQLNQNCWAQSSVKVNNIKVFNEENVLIFDKYSNWTPYNE